MRTITNGWERRFVVVATSGDAATPVVAVALGGDASGGIACR